MFNYKFIMKFKQRNQQHGQWEEAYVASKKKCYTSQFHVSEKVVF